MIPKMKAKLNKTNSENTQNNIPSLNFIKPVQYSEQYSAFH